MTMIADQVERSLASSFGRKHPMWWPTVMPSLPKWWQFGLMRHEAKITAALKSIGGGPITQEMRNAYWREVRKGQGVNEDAGGYGMRQWYAMLGLPIEEPASYADAIDAILAEGQGSDKP